MTEANIAKLANTTTTTTTDWVPPAGSDYAGLIVDKAQAARMLAGVAAAVVHQKESGSGASVRVRISPKRTAQGPIAEGSSLTATATTTDQVDITLSAYGDYDQMTGQSIFQTNGPLVAKVLEAMGRGIARKLDSLVWDALEAATPGASKTLATKGDLTTSDDFAVKTLELIAAMQKLDVEPDYLLCGPDQIAALRQTKAQNYMIGSAVGLDNNGNVTSFGGLKVINMKSLGNANAATVNLVHAIAIDSSRAFGEAYGRPLRFEEDRVIESDLYKRVCWIDYGTAVIDTDGIGHVVNAAA